MLYCDYIDKRLKKDEHPSYLFLTTPAENCEEVLLLLIWSMEEEKKKGKHVEIHSFGFYVINLYIKLTRP